MGFVSNAVGGVLGGITGGLMDSSGMKNTFAGQAPDIQKQDLISQINKANDFYNSTITPQQQAYIKSLQDQAAGKGPNPSQEMLNQATNRNVQQGAGMIASQKGISPALAARLIANNTASANQTAAGQGALMGAQQQLASQGLLGNAINSAANSNLSQQGILQNAQASQNNAINTGSLGAQGLTAKAAEQNANSAGQLVGGLMQGAGAVAGLYSGGRVPGYADGGDVERPDWQTLIGADSGKSGAYQAGAGMGALGAMLGKKLLSPTIVGSAVGPAGSSDLMSSPIAQTATTTAAHGTEVRGTAPFPGDDPRNDIVDAKLSPDEIVLPRSVTLAHNAPAKAAEFVEKIQQQDNKKKSTNFLEALNEHREKERLPSEEEGGFKKVLEARRHINNAMKALK